MLYTNNGRVPCRLKSAGGQMWVLRPAQSIEVDEDMVAPAFISKTGVTSVAKAAEAKGVARKAGGWAKKKSAPAKDDPKTTKD